MSILLHSPPHPHPCLLSAFPSVLHIHPPSDFDLSFHLSFPTTHPLLTSLVLGETRIKGRRICLATSPANTDVFHNNDHHVFRNMWGLGVAQKHSTCLACKDPELHPQHQFLSYWKCIWFEGRAILRVWICWPDPTLPTRAAWSCGSGSGAALWWLEEELS